MWRFGFWVLFLACFVLAQPTSYLLGPETFDTWIPTGWQVIDGGPVGTWYQWSNLARIDGSVVDYQDDWLISAPFDGSSPADSIVLRYWHQLSHYLAEQGSCLVLLSVDGGTTWPETLVVYGPGFGTDVETVDVRIDNLPTPLSGNCRVAFKYGYYNSNYWYVDYVSVGLYISEPSPPTFDHASYYRPVFPMTATSYPETVYIYDVTGVSPTSVQLCYDVNSGSGYSGSFTCVGMSAVSIDGYGRGTYAASIPMQDPWDMVRYYFIAEDTYVPPSVGVSDTFELVVQGRYYVYDNTDIYDEAPDATFRDITSVGTNLGISADDDRTMVTLPFVFRYYGYDYTTLWVCTNGWACFGLDPGTNDYSNNPIPDAASPNALLAPLWDDLTMVDGAVYTYTSADGDTFIIEWNNARELSGSVYYNFEIILVNPAACDEVAGNGEVIFKYQSIDAAGLDDATVGIENEDGSLGVEYLYDGTYGSGIEIVDGAAPLPPGPSALKFTPNRPPGGVIRGHVTLAGETDHSGVLVAAEGALVLTDYTDSTGYYEISVTPGTYNVSAYKDYHWTTDTVFGVAVAVDETVTVDFTLNRLPFVSLIDADFEVSDGGFTVSGGGWEWGTPTSGPGAAHSGSNLWATVLDGDYGSNADYSLLTPSVDLSYVEPPIYLSFWGWYDTESWFDNCDLDISTDGGGSWTTLASYSGHDATWRNEAFDLSGYAGDTVVIRWRLTSDGSINYPGWYIDDVVLEGIMSRYGVVRGNVTLVGETDHSGVIVGAMGPMTFSTATATDGSYEMLLLPGTYDIYAYNGGAWETDTAYDVVVYEGETLIVNFVLNPIPVGYVVGYADLSETPGPDAGITCELLGASATTHTDGSGMYFFDEVPVGTYAVKASYSGYSSASSGLFDVEAGETTYVDTIFLASEPYYFDFEADDGGFSPTPISGGWEWGVPTAGPPSAHSGSNCWGTVLDGYYDNDADWQLVVDVTSFASSLTTMEFYHWYDFEDGYDGGNISVSTDGGFTWELVVPEGGYDAVIPTTYGSPIGGEMAFSGSSGDWVYEVVDLSAYAGVATHVRFRFGSDNSVSGYYGWYVDDVFFPTLPPPLGCIEGYVYDADSYTTISGARVVCQGETTYTDASGHYVLCDIPVGYYPVYAAYPGYAANYEMAIVAQDTTFGLI